MHRCSYQSARTVPLHTNWKAYRPTHKQTNETVVAGRRWERDNKREEERERTNKNRNALDAWPMSTLIFHSILSLEKCSLIVVNNPLAQVVVVVLATIYTRRGRIFYIRVYCAFVLYDRRLEPYQPKMKMVCKAWALLHILLLLYKWQWIWTTFGYCVLATATASWAKRRRMATAAAAVAKIKLKKKNSTCQEPKDQIEE